MKAGALVHRAVEGIRAVTGADGVTQQVRVPVQMATPRTYMLTDSVVTKEFLRLFIQERSSVDAEHQIPSDPEQVHVDVSIPASVLEHGSMETLVKELSPIARALAARLQGRTMHSEPLSVPRGATGTSITAYGIGLRGIAIHEPEKSTFRFDVRAQKVAA